MLIFAAGLLAIMLLIAAISDFRTREIPNKLNIAIAVTAPLAWWAADLALWPTIAYQVGAALAVFAAFIGLFAIGGMGGGDVKLIGAVALWIDYRLIFSLLLVMALVGGVIAAVMLIHKKITKSEGTSEVPYGIAIAIAGFWAINQQYINHFPLIPSN
jgi:prepilin peptidase CpaA